MLQEQLEKASREFNLRQATILNFVERHISCWRYFCQIAKFGENILNQGKLLQVEYFQYGGFDLQVWPSPSKVNSDNWRSRADAKIRAIFNENQTVTCGEITWTPC